MKKKDIREIPELVSRLYELVGSLERHFPERRFTPDGHLVGSLGEVEEVFNGPGAVAWRNAGAKQSNGQRPISIGKLRALGTGVPQRLRLRRVRELPGP